MDNRIVFNNPRGWPPGIPGVAVVPARLQADAGILHTPPA